jgi:NADH-quinone oxidoreductase subunit K
MQPTQVPIQVPEVIQLIDLKYYLIISTALFVIGIIGVLTRRNAIIIFMSIELMLNSVNLMLIAFSSYRARSYRSGFCLFHHGSCCGRSSHWARHHRDDLPQYPFN